MAEPSLERFISNSPRLLTAVLHYIIGRHGNFHSKNFCPAQLYTQSGASPSLLIELAPQGQKECIL